MLVKNRLTSASVGLAPSGDEWDSAAAGGGCRVDLALAGRVCVEVASHVS